MDLTNKQLISSHLCMTKHIGINGNLFGGEMVSWLDTAGAIFASKKAKAKQIVTVEMDKVQFNKPVRVGDVIEIYGEVNRIGRTSITVTVTAINTNIETEENYKVCETNMVFVKIDSKGKPTAI